MRRRPAPTQSLMFKSVPPYQDNLKLSVRVRKAHWQEWVDRYYYPAEREYQAHVEAHGWMERPETMPDMPDAPFDRSEV